MRNRGDEVRQQVSSHLWVALEMRQNSIPLHRQSTPWSCTRWEKGWKTVSAFGVGSLTISLSTSGRWWHGHSSKALGTPHCKGAMDVPEGPPKHERWWGVSQALWRKLLSLLWKSGQDTLTWKGLLNCLAANRVGEVLPLFPESRGLMHFHCLVAA